MIQSNENNQQASIREVYSLIAEMRKEVTGSITRLENKFDNLEAGRLSNLETKFADFKGNLQGRMAVIAVVVSVVIGLITVIVTRYLTAVH